MIKIEHVFMKRYGMIYWKKVNHRKEINEMKKEKMRYGADNNQ